MTKTKILLLLLLFQCSLSGLQAQQWFRYSGYPMNAVPKDVTVNDAGTLFMVTKSNQVFYKPLDGTWTEIPGPLPPDGTYWQTPSITVEKASNRLYVGSDVYPGGLFVTSDLGQTWEQYSLVTNPVSGLHENYYCFTEIKNPNLFFAGTIGGVVKLTNRGATGQIIPFGNPFISTPEAIHYTRNNKLLIGSFNDGIWLSTDDGGNIRHANFTAKQVYRFAEAPNGRVYALCKNLVTQMTELIYSDTYVDWTSVSLPDPAQTYTSLYCDSAAATLWLGSASGLYKTSLSTISWQSANLNNSAHNVVEVIGDRNGIYDFSNQYVAQKRNAAATAWEQINEGLRGEINNIFFNANNKLFAFNYLNSESVAALAPPAGTPPVLSGWQQAPVGPAGANIQFVCNDQHPGVLYALTSQRKFFRSEDDGISFTATALPPEFNAALVQVHQLIPGQQSGLFLVGRDGPDPALGGKLFGSFDKGNTWSELGRFSAAGIETVSQDATGRLFALVVIDSTLNNNLYTSVDTGRTWSLVMEDALPFSNRTLVSSGSRTFLYSDWELFEINPANATPNTPIGLPWPSGTSGRELRNLAVSRTGTLYLFNDGLYRSTDNGANWQSLGKPDITLPDIDFLGTNQLCIAFDSIPFILPAPVAAKDKGIYYWRNAPLLSIHKVSKEHNLVVFPNPAAYTLQVKTDYRGNISLLNVLGQELNRYRIKKEETEIDISNIAPGIYFIRLEETGQSIKIVKQ
ncbi:T9SS type A sorting domain-containing protein [Taibaiella helva]|uniref:T9SS type A sorting domain-containing protein n=1 Tax=Taibaiella helva TaxID=2301235 RepID=UPI000E597074|nr:T9SS type A sorting domain-containing protein [Taibaiella helva]